MNHKVKNIPANESLTCEKYVRKMLRQDKAFATKRSPAPSSYQEKLATVVKHPLLINNPRAKPKFNVRQRSPVPKSAPTIITTSGREQDDGLSPLITNFDKAQSCRTRSSSRSESKERESWGQMLQKNRGRDRTSTFSNFDPLRTVHFLSKELQTKLQDIIPDDDDILQILSDIQYALKRIPPEVTTLLHTQLIDLPIRTDSEKSCSINKVSTSNKSCQTPPTLYQEDTEKFQKIMEENTYRLEASCKQLEVVCTNLQSEKEMTEKELDEARENVDLLCKRIKGLEMEMEEITSIKIKQLEDEKLQLQEELRKALDDLKNNPTITSLKKLVDELKKQKAESEDARARLEYDMTLLKMEKEKFVTMLTVRDREIKDIQEEMTKIQDQVKKQLSKLSDDLLSRVTSVKTFSDIGDTTISSINSNDSDREPVNIVKESPCGDAEVAGLVQERPNNLAQKLTQIKSSNVELDLASNKDYDAVLEDLLKGLSPSCKALLNNAS